MAWLLALKQLEHRWRGDDRIRAWVEVPRHGDALCRIAGNDPVVYGTRQDGTDRRDHVSNRRCPDRTVCKGNEGFDVRAANICQ